MNKNDRKKHAGNQKSMGTAQSPPKTTKGVRHKTMSHAGTPAPHKSAQKPKEQTQKWKKQVQRTVDGTKGGSFFTPAAVGSKLISSNASNSPLIFKGTELLTDIVVNSAVSPDSFNRLIVEYLSPSNYGLFRKLSYTAAIFEKFRFLRLRFDYHPMVSTATNGGIFMSVKMDAKEAVDASEMALMDNGSAVMSNVYTPLSFSPRIPKTWLYTAPIAPTTPAEQRQDYPGFFEMFSQGVDGRMLGSLTMTYEVEFLVQHNPLPTLASGYRVTVAAHAVGYNIGSDNSGTSVTINPLRVHVHRTVGFTRSKQTYQNLTFASVNIKDNWPGLENWTSFSNPPSLIGLNMNGNIRTSVQTSPVDGNYEARSQSIGFWQRHRGADGTITFRLYQVWNAVTLVAEFANVSISTVLDTGADTTLYGPVTDCGFVFFCPSNVLYRSVEVLDLRATLFDATNTNYPEPQTKYISAPRDIRSFVLPDQLAAAVAYLDDCKGTVNIAEADRQLQIDVSENAVLRRRLDELEKLIFTNTTPTQNVTTVTNIGTAQPKPMTEYVLVPRK